MNEKFFIDNLWRRSIGKPEKVFKPFDFEHVKKSQWSTEFEQLMRNRLLFGYFRYAPLSEQKKGKMNNIGSIEKRIAKYKETGNDELLVDVANICMVEFLLGNHPNKHFASEDDGEHVEEN